jgi:predicted GNAT family N-acyltransferase
MNDISIEQIRPELTWKLRREILYPEQTIAEMKMDEDDDGYHFAAFRNNYIVAVVSLFKRDDSWQFRKFAVVSSVQGKGIGGRMLQYISDFVINEGGTKLWCNARLTAIPFYLKHDFVQKGEHFSKNGFDYEILEKDLSA